MSKATKKFETTFDRMHEEDVEFNSYFMEVDGNKKEKHIRPPKGEDWVNVKMFCNFLRHFYEVTLSFTGSLFVTSTYFCELVGIQNELHRLCGIDGDPLIKEMAQSMKEKYEKYWGDIENMNLMMFIAVVLDLRYKMKYLKYWFNKWYSKETAEFALKLGTELSSASGNGQATNVASSIESSASFPCDPWKIASHEFDEHIATEDDNECTTNVDKYLNEASKKNREGFDILASWTENSTRYVILSKVARDIMAIPVSTIAFESTFSTGGHVLDPFRSSLAPKTVEALIYAQNWLKNPSKPKSLRSNE
ncbi:zinc finger BED domain-containing protein DAYSLEEPER-like [Castanea sativa]|uniref:zinc finger BED domain-containing protein DAYSLEEPER-like n=1 Tax=Castanea sativa TaxID=21020 RepID=UPI003F64D77A